MAQIPSGGPFGLSSRGQPLGYRSAEGEMSVGSFFNLVYAWMAVGLAVTAAVAYGLYAYLGPLPISRGVWLLMLLVEVALVVGINRGINKISVAVATLMFLVLAAINGLVFSGIFYAYTSTSIGAVFVVTAGMFGAVSLYGFTTKRDLTGIGTFLFMALIGLILASVVNLFLHSTLMQWIVSYAGVAIFVGFTAYDTQRLKVFAEANAAGGNQAMLNRVAIIGSLMLYLDFINLFSYLLQIMGDRRR